MRTRYTAIALAVLITTTAIPTANAEEKEHAPSQLNSPAQKLGYALGMEVGTTLKDWAQLIDFSAFVKGAEDALRDNARLLSPEEASQVKRDAFVKVQQQRNERQKSVGEENQKAGEAFLAENKTKDGVVTTDSGLQYTVLHEGDGPKPAASDKVKVHYRGTLLDGTEFDSSYKRGQPATFPLNGVIAGWTEGVQLMNVGSKHRLFVPSKMAYGQRGAPPTIGPNAVLIFEVELLSIE